MSWEVSNRRARAFRAAIGATVESLESRQLFAAVPQVSIAATDPIASEVGLDTGTYRVTRSGNLSAPLVVNLIVGGRATNGVDYGTIGNAITLAAGQSTFDFLVRPVSDTKVEPTESITVSLGASSAYSINPDAPLGNVLLKDGGGATLAEIASSRPTSTSSRTTSLCHPATSSTAVRATRNSPTARRTAGAPAKPPIRATAILPGRTTSATTR
jgi:hypothetical protein